ncbi:4-(cytidine 5'-diphospho)-2-C-methyl-D-erythritol kinase [Sphingobacterium sp. N143]|uniref:4-(cytidine 5'-diphospho)-2-C-methyl-D-erythritol kinase n=1 Tax=Sphingobacterium sp. N143 TaxID=2746727 RepID=UPI002577113E|nr:4-(cytidine 5'-diphospho)-2-C-methyl-D-erythritol kinase [Sphingobacterium sp. N143]MDM1296381.1 4-(cytidine 5'-diphospho)-2-C-methyl-D-erythritol kinase [Sphingobacterium sp. N143]
MILFANAKINIGLQVIAKRADGYHELNSVFYPLPIYDVIELLETTSDLPSLNIQGQYVPGDIADNLCIKAYELLRKEYVIPTVSIDLIKQIPIGAGLGGGSADAAFILKGLNELFRLELRTEELEAYATQLGADCPFFISNTAVFARGIGTDFKKISLSLDPYFMVVIMPDIHVSTAEAYHTVKPKLPEVNLEEAIRLPIQEWKFHIRNDFEEGIFERYPLLKEIKEALYQKGAIYASMSGSGSAIYGIFWEQIDLNEFVKYGRIYYPSPMTS